MLGQKCFVLFPLPAPLNLLIKQSNPYCLLNQSFLVTLNLLICLLGDGTEFTYSWSCLHLHIALAFLLKANISICPTMATVQLHPNGHRTYSSMDIQALTSNSKALSRVQTHLFLAQGHCCSTDNTRLHDKLRGRGGVKPASSSQFLSPSLFFSPSLQKGMA